MIKAIKRLDNGKSSGPDNVTAEMLKAAPQIFIEYLTIELKNIFEQMKIADFGAGKFILLPNRGKRAGQLGGKTYRSPVNAEKTTTPYNLTYN